ncbi:MAG TPA: TatD family hydrolase, partial [Terriglobia bacterium]|nr:TatD family hydrolase [Terriglobia bacterium]
MAGPDLQSTTGRGELRFYDAHNHLQDERLDVFRRAAISSAAAAGVTQMVVNGSGEADWPAVAALAEVCPMVIPSFGYHPWYTRERTPAWQQVLERFLKDWPSAGVGEIGLDRWIKDFDSVDQEGAFVPQLHLAAALNRPASLHCLKAWGRLLEILKAEPLPACGFLLHSFGGPHAMISPLADLGAYFSLPGYFAHERKARQREAFRHVPADRLLIETDAPDQLLPPERNHHPLADLASGKALNHPANLRAVYEFASEFLNRPLRRLVDEVEVNFQRLFKPRERTSA